MIGFEDKLYEEEMNRFILWNSSLKVIQLYNKLLFNFLVLE